MSIAAACGGWIAAAVLTALWLAVQRVLDARMEAVARACHELRGPIGAARLGLELGSRAGTLSAEQLRAIDSELGRATLALDDLTCAPEGRSAPWEVGSGRPRVPARRDGHSLGAARRRRRDRAPHALDRRHLAGARGPAPARTGGEQPDRERNRTWGRVGRSPRLQRAARWPDRESRPRSGDAGPDRGDRRRPRSSGAARRADSPRSTGQGPPRAGSRHRGRGGCGPRGPPHRGAIRTRGAPDS